MMLLPEQAKKDKQSFSDDRVNKFVLINLFSSIHISYQFFTSISLFIYFIYFIYFYQSTYFHFMKLTLNTLELISSKYYTRANITRSLYILYPLIEGQKSFLQKILPWCMVTWLIFKSGLR